MSWPSRTMGQTLSGDGVETLGVTLWDRDAIAGGVSWSWPDGSASMTEGLSDSFLSFFRMPVYAEATAVITLTFVAKRDGAVSGNADFRLRGRKYGGTFSSGSTLNTALTTAFAPYQVTLAVPASPAWTTEGCEFVLQSSRPASGADVDWKVSLEFLTANMRVVPISP